MKGSNPSHVHERITYEPLRLMQAVMAKTNEVCLRYLDNSMLCSLPSPADTHVFYPTSACAVKNSRRKMEDRHVVIHDLNTMFNIQDEKDRIERNGGSVLLYGTWRVNVGRPQVDVCSECERHGTRLKDVNLKDNAKKVDAAEVMVHETRAKRFYNKIG
nr:unnamed protein product [Callosobruchus analis]